MRHPIKNKKKLRPKNILLTLVQLILKNGKKKKAKNILIEVFKYIKLKKKQENVFFVFLKALYNISPRIKNVTKQATVFNIEEKLSINNSKNKYSFIFETFVPKIKVASNIELLFYQETITLGLTILIKNSKKQKSNIFAERIANEILDAYENKGNSVKEKFLIERNVFRKAEID